MLFGDIENPLAKGDFLAVAHWTAWLAPLGRIPSAQTAGRRPGTGPHLRHSGNSLPRKIERSA
jgi:hypothetical protein